MTSREDMFPTGTRSRRKIVRNTASRRLAEARGRLAEAIAAVVLMAKGYRILARRHRTPFGEIDIIAVRGRRLSFVEVKQRRDFDAALASITPHGAGRIGDAVELWLGRNPCYREYRVGLDAIIMGRHLIPRHIEGALHAW